PFSRLRWPAHRTRVGLQCRLSVVKSKCRTEYQRGRWRSWRVDKEWELDADRQVQAAAHFERWVKIPAEGWAALTQTIALICEVLAVVDMYVADVQVLARRGVNVDLHALEQHPIPELDPSDMATDRQSLKLPRSGERYRRVHPCRW